MFTCKKKRNGDDQDRVEFFRLIKKQFTNSERETIRREKRDSDNKKLSTFCGERVI